MNVLRALSAGALLLATLAAGCSVTPAGPAPASGASVTVNVVLSNAGCAPDKPSVPAGAVTFNVTNQGGESVSEAELMQGERIIAERENLTPGLSGSFSVDLEPGSYTLYCPGASTPKTPFEVTAAP